jgi:succinate dehydrogenase/fumarate reductase flavoprotein subunit
MTEAQTIRFGEYMAQRTCAAADRGGHAILQTLYQRCLEHNTEFFVEYFALDLLIEEMVLAAACPPPTWSTGRCSVSGCILSGQAIE